MKDDERLVETVCAAWVKERARYLCVVRTGNHPVRVHLDGDKSEALVFEGADQECQDWIDTQCARAALAAIDDSCIAWVAPWKMTTPMHDAYNIAFKNGCSAGALWSSLRGAHLVE